MGKPATPDTAPSDGTVALAEAWLQHSGTHESAHLIERLARYAPDQGWPGILAVLSVPDSSAHLEALSRPLRMLISQFGPAYIDRIESEAAANPRFRECLVGMYPDPAFPILEELWPRLSAAAEQPVGPIPPHVAELYAEVPDLIYVSSCDPQPLDPQDAPALSTEELTVHAQAWVKHQQTAWAVDELLKMQDDGGPEAVWSFILAVVERGDDRALGSLGAGLLENLLVKYGDSIILRVEAAAASDPRFCFCLGCVWPQNMPEVLWNRIVAASGERR